MPEQIETRVVYDGAEYDFRTWAGWLSLDDAERRGTYRSGEADGSPAIGRRSAGDGTVTYCGCWPEAELADALATDLLDAAGVAYAQRFPQGVRAAERDGYTWVTNFTGDRVTLDVPSDAEFVVGGPTLDAFDVAVVDSEVSAVSGSKK